MNLYNPFKRQQNELTTASNASEEKVSVTEFPLPEIEERVFIETAATAPATSTTQFLTTSTPKPAMDTPIQSANDNNIALLYAFMDRNHESKGYDDALLNPDTSHLNQNLDALKNDLIRTINKVKMFYEDFIEETEYHILSRSRSGMVDIVEELEMKKRIALGHMAKVKEIEQQAGQDQGDCKGMLISYTRGFNNGLAAISHHNILTKRF
jgi:hypothetical protein